MTNEQVLEIFKKTGALITDSHLVYTSGKHGSMYMNKDAIYPHTEETSKLCRAIAEEFRGKGVEVVAAPALGGIILSQWVAHYLTELEGREITGVYTEKTPEKNQIFTRGYDIFVKGKKVLIVEDTVNTGGSVVKVVNAVRDAGGTVTAVAVLCNRGITAKEAGDVPELFALTSLKMDAWDEAECPLCKQGVPINITVGKGREYLKKKAL